MQLTRLTICGFKSFAKPVIFDFSEGITAIAGPNGSGKSNVLDAIRWALGEQSAKALRGKKMDDILYNGSAKSDIKCYAKVSLAFDNSKGHM